ncbi:type II toxin-antitoxin system antitoxin SocA domain-containing protein, partial [Klebsiella pneumoniae]|uniref:type II toxin-antitoxin system antitoxin SocA domain-containing protein n=2 Tax=Klebsiella TaxID=570 RepID=UPI001B8CC88A
LVKNGGELESGWNHWIRGAENYEVALKPMAVSVEDLDELSEADIEILDSIMAEFGHMSKYQIRDFTHDHCAEWQDPGCTSVAIPHS